MIPNWCKLQKSDVELIGFEVAKAEKHTRCEIVPMIVRSSACSDHVPVILFLSVLVVALLLEHWLQNVWVYPAWAGVAVSLVLAVFSMPLARLSFVRRHLTSKADRRHQALVRAQLEFWDAGIADTKGRVGVLLFVSMDEHQCVVLADQAIASELPPDTWKQVLDLILTKVRQGQLARGLADAITEVGRILAERFPAPAQNPNELPNELIIKD